MTTPVLALNAGSSTLKYTLYAIDGAGERELTAATVKTPEGPGPGALDAVLAELRRAGHPEPTLVGHRLVHGGERFTAQVVVDEAVLAELDELAPLAPLHMPQAIFLLRAALERCPRALHVACFDTAFHHTLPEVARRFALPDDVYRKGVRRYGFHGLSYEFVVSALGSPTPERLVVAHLGSGASLCAIKGGRSIDTSMGLSPAGGIPMGTRPGDLDPGVLVHLLRHDYDIARLEQLINHEAGLLGVSGSADMTELLRRADAGDPQARLGIELFGYAIKKQLGAYAAALGGLDCLVFTGGIGEHAPRIRELAASGLEVLGIALDSAKNAANAAIISAPGSACQVRVVATNEDLVIARHAFALAQRATVSSSA